MTATAHAGTTSGRARAQLVASVQDLSIHFQTKSGMLHAVDEVSFEIRDGETLGLVGETGCGKTVTARAFMRLIATPPGVYAGGRIDFWSSEGRIAQALACDPDLLIADEPTTALDVTVQARILELIADLLQRHDTSVLYISHDLALVREICDRVAVMYAGRIVEIGLTEEVFSDPLHPYTRGLMSAVPSSAHRRGKLAAIEGSVPELIEPAPSCRVNTR